MPLRKKVRCWYHFRNIHTVTKAGTIRISLTTEKTQTHEAGQKVFGILTVNKGAKTSAPAKPDVTNATENGGNNGKITGLIPNTRYEYKKDNESYKEVTSNENGEISGLSAGSYVIRFAETELFLASADSLTVIIGQPGTSNGGNTGGNTGGNSGGNSAAAPVILPLPQAVLPPFPLRQLQELPRVRRPLTTVEMHP